MGRRACQQCGSNFNAKVFWQKFCSTACKFIAYGKKQKVEKNKDALAEANKAMRGKKNGP